MRRSRHPHPSPESWPLDDGRRPVIDLVTPATDGTELRIRVAAPARAAGRDLPPIVLAHCWTGDWRIWEPVAARLAATRTVVLWDHRDHGSSGTSPAGAASVDQLAADLLTVIDHLDIERAVVAGHSMGGMTALATALAAPERVAALGLVSTSAAPAAWPAGAGAALPRLVSLVGSERLDADGLDGRRGTAAVRGALGRKAHPDAVARVRATFAATSPSLRARWLEAIGEFDVRGRLDEITCPTTVVVGRLDSLLATPHSRALHEGIPHSSLHVLPGAGHMLPLERPDSLDALLTDLTDPTSYPAPDQTATTRQGVLR